nr:hypothetical protein [Kibdelosporangium sp. MJ126-NF4]
MPLVHPIRVLHAEPPRESIMLTSIIGAPGGHVKPSRPASVRSS